MAHLYVKNRRDGSRLLSIALIIATVGLMASDHPIGRGVAAIASALSLYWWLLYRRLPD